MMSFDPQIAHIHFKDVRNQIKEKVYKEKLSFLQAVKLGVFTVPGGQRLEGRGQKFKAGARF